MAKYPMCSRKSASVIRGVGDKVPVKVVKKGDMCACPEFPTKRGRRAEMLVMRKGTLKKSKAITSSREACKWVRTQAYVPQEEVVALYLNNKNQVIAESLVSKGTSTQALVSTANVLQSALLSNAAGIILVHNHPSGDATPSNTDVKLTQKLREAAELLDVDLLDHLVVGQEDGLAHCKSLRDLGLING